MRRTNLKRPGGGETKFGMPIFKNVPGVYNNYFAYGAKILLEDKNTMCRFGLVQYGRDRIWMMGLQVELLRSRIFCFLTK